MDSFNYDILYFILIFALCIFVFIYIHKLKLKLDLYRSNFNCPPCPKKMALSECPPCPVINCPKCECTPCPVINCPKCECPPCPVINQTRDVLLDTPRNSKTIFAFGSIGDNSRSMYPNIYNNIELSPPLVPPQMPSFIKAPLKNLVLVPKGLPQGDVRPLVAGSFNEYQLVGQLHKFEEKIDTSDPYKILPLYGKPYKGGFFKYYTTYKSGGQFFKMFITRHNNKFNRELNDGDEIKLDNPINAKYIFKEGI